MTPTWFQAILLGIVQGLAEFIPISSKGHVVLVPYLLGWDPPGLAFTVALHLGTLAAVVLFFRWELLAMARGLLGRGGPDDALFRRLALYAVVATVPVAVVGYLFEGQIQDLFDNPQASAVLLFGTAGILLAGEARRDGRVRAGAGTTRGRSDVDAPSVWTGDWVGGTATAVAPTESVTLPVGDDPADPAGRGLDRMRVTDAVGVGLAQCLALLPGISRSGTTIVGGLFSGLTREAATRFSFLLSIPAVLGAFVLEAEELTTPGFASGLDIGVGVFASFVSGYLAIRFLVALVARDRLTGFAKYCIVAGVVGLLGYQMIGPVP